MDPQFSAYRDAYLQQYPHANDAQVLDAYNTGLQMMKATGPQPKSALGQAYSDYIGDPATQAVSGVLQKVGQKLGMLPTPAPVQSGDPLSNDAARQAAYGKRVMDPVAQAIVPQTPAQAAAALAPVGVGMATRAASPAIAGASRMLAGPVAGAATNMLDKGATKENAAEGAIEGLPGALTEGAVAGKRLAQNVVRTARPMAEGNALAKDFIKGLSKDLDVPNFSERLSALTGKESSNALVATEQVRKVMQEVIDSAEKRVTAALGGPGAALPMPSLAVTKKSTVLGQSPATISTTMPTVEEAFKAVKDAKAKARLAMRGAELQLALDAVQTARNLQVEFDRVVDAALAAQGSSVNTTVLQRARKQYARGMDVLDVLEDPKIFEQGPRGLTLSQPGLAGAMRTQAQAGGFSAQNFPNAVKAAARGGADFAADQTVNLPFMSFRGVDPLGRAGFGSIPIATRFAGQPRWKGATAAQAVGPSALRSIKALMDEAQGPRNDE